MKTTSIFIFKKPDLSDRPDITVTNENWDKLETELNPTINQDIIPTQNVGKLSEIVSWVTNRIKAITGKANWYDSPTKSLEQLNNEKVDKITGKELSANDFTNIYKSKLDGIADGANKTILNNTTNSASTSEAATANAVKMAYDLANHGHPYAPESHTHTKAQINDFPSSLPANGGNADTIGGKHASDFTTVLYLESYGKFRNYVELKKIADFNQISFGNYSFDGSYSPSIPLNAPPNSTNSDHYFIECIESGGEDFVNKIQTVTRIHEPIQQEYVLKVFFRYYSEYYAEWSSWEEVSTTSRLNIFSDNLKNGWVIREGDISFNRSGDIVNANGAIIMNGVTSVGTFLFNVPKAICPKNTQYCKVACIKSGETSYTNGYLKVSSTGSITLGEGIKNGALILDFSYNINI